MKTTIRQLTALGLALALTVGAASAQETPKPADKPATPPETVAPERPAPDRERTARQQARRAARQEARAKAQAEAATTPDAAAAAAPGTTKDATPPTESTTPTVAKVTVPAPAKEPELRMNFREVPLSQVLDYMSDAAGFTIVLETQVSGNVSVWSNQALTKAEAVALLDSVLNKNGYAALQNGRTLTIVPKAIALKRDIPIRVGGEPDIKKTDKMITQIIPVKNINVTQLARDLSPLIPETASLQANEGANALVMTDTEINIHRIADIVAKLDGQVSSSTSVKVFTLRYADSKAMATVIQNLYQNQYTGGRGGNNGGGGGGFGGGGNPFQQLFQGGGFGGGGFGGGRSGGGGGGRGGN